MKAFQEPGYFGGLLGRTASTRLYERTPREPRANIAIAKAMNGVGAREQGLEGSLIRHAERVEGFNGLPGRGSLRLASRKKGRRNYKVISSSIFLSWPPAIHLTQLDAVAFFNLLPETVIRHRLAIMRDAANQR